MNNQQSKVCDCYIDVDRMINEGLGGGHLEYDYDWKRLEVKQVQLKKIPQKSDDEG